MDHQATATAAFHGVSPDGGIRQSPAREARVEELDSLRGIAALTVVFHHCLVIFPAFWAAYDPRHVRLDWVVRVLAFSPLHLAWGGVEAVNVFFVLSGLVLALPFLGSAAPRYGQFVLKRMVRIYPPYFVMMTFAVLIMEAVLPLGHPLGSSWFGQYWGRNADGGTFADYIFVLGGTSENFVNPVIWSLVHEFRISLVFPVLIWLVITRRPREMLLVSLSVSLAAKLFLHFVVDSHPLRTLIDTSQYLFFFVAGAEIAKHRLALTGIYRQMGPSMKVCALCVSLLLLNARWELPSAWHELSALCLWLGAPLVVTFALVSAGPGSFLRWKPLQWIGQISYSLYLTHCIVLFAAMFLMSSRVPAPWIALCVPFVSILLAAAVHQMIELPALALSRKCSVVKPGGNAVASAR